MSETIGLIERAAARLQQQEPGEANPSVVVPAVTFGWSITDATAIERARTGGAIAQLTRILGPEPAGIERVRDSLGRASTSLRVAGKPLYAGVLAQALAGGTRV